MNESEPDRKTVVVKIFLVEVEKQNFVEKIRTASSHSVGEKGVCLRQQFYYLQRKKK